MTGVQTCALPIFGIDQLTYDFRVESLSDCIKVMEHLADKVLPVARRLG